MSREHNSEHISRRTFTGVLTGAAGTGSLLAQQVKKKAPQNANTTPQTASHPKAGLPPEPAPFGETLVFTRNDIRPKLHAFQMTEVRLLPSIFADAQTANRDYLHRLDSERLLHNFRVNAGLPSSAQPLGGWEKPDCELRGHFVGHYLSACGLMYSSTADQELQTKADYIVAELAKCQTKLGGGYLSAFPTE